MPSGFEQLTNSSESKRRHIIVNVLILSFRDHVGLVPNANVPAVTDILTKPAPGRQMSQLRLLCISRESLKRLPVLEKQYRPTKPKVTAPKAEIRLPPKLGQHAWHRKEDRQPLMNFPWPIDSHPNEKDAEWLLHSCCHALGYNHDWSPKGWMLISAIQLGLM
jgi:hypothetical protein